MYVAGSILFIMFRLHWNPEECIHNAPREREHQKADSKLTGHACVFHSRLLLSSISGAQMLFYPVVWASTSIWLPSSYNPAATAGVLQHAWGIVWRVQPLRERIRTSTKVQILKAHLSVTAQK